VIDQIDSALKAWLTSVLKPTPVEITFRAPDEPPNQRKPLVCAELYDIVEEESARSNHIEDIRGDNGRVIARQAAARRFVLSYQLSVVVADAAVEHQLLGRILKGGVNSECLPADELPEELQASGFSVPLQIAKPRPGVYEREPTRFGDAGWRATLDLTLVVPVLPDPVTEIAPPAEILDLGVSRERGNGDAAPADADTGDARRAIPPENRKWTSVRRREP
jgi:hypothetical protein